MTGDRIIAVVAGTPDIHLPLYRHLRQVMLDEVVLVEHSGGSDLGASLKSLAARGDVIAIPCNEITLNRLQAAIAGAADLPQRVRVPGTAVRERPYSAAELSDKAALRALVKGAAFSGFDVVRTEVLRWDGQRHDLAPVEGLRFPVVVKPAAKDERDSFTAAFPAKVFRADSPAALHSFLEETHRNLVCGRDLLAQELAEGLNVSWCGYACGGEVSGHRIVPLVKSPEGETGGTTTLARLEEPDEALAAAARELAHFLKLDGVFEIEFMLRDGRLAFLCEINPRPLLQVSLLLGRQRDVFVEYLVRSGCRRRADARPSPHSLPVLWGSASRYFELNRGLISPATFWRIARHDVRFGAYFGVAEKAACAARLVGMFARAAGRVCRGQPRSIDGRR